MSKRSGARSTGAGRRPAAGKPASAKAATPPKARKTTKRVTATEPLPSEEPMQRLRTLGDVEQGGGRRVPQRAQGAKKAREILRAEFDRVLEMKEKLRAEAAVGGKEKGREAVGQAEKVRALIASLEGMNRFALQMGLITPAESRDLYGEAMKRGLYEGWR